MEETVYVTQPEGFETKGSNNEDLVCRQHKSLFDFRQSLRNWNGKTDTWLISHVFGASSADPCLDIRSDGLVFLLLHVNDILLSGGDIKAIEDTKNELMREVAMNDVGPVNTFVGTQIVREPDMGRIRLMQGKHIAQTVWNEGMKQSSNIFTQGRTPKFE